jgi:hypothetical protein
MQVHCDEGIANHNGPEPCAGTRENVGEASVGERIGQPLSLENIFPLGATLSTRRKATRSSALPRNNVNGSRFTVLLQFAMVFFLLPRIPRIIAPIRTANLLRSANIISLLPAGEERRAFLHSPAPLSKSPSTRCGPWLRTGMNVSASGDWRSRTRCEPKGPRLRHRGHGN